MSPNDASTRVRASASARSICCVSDCLARPQPLGDLLDPAASLDRVRLQLVQRLRDGLLRRLLQLLAEPQHGRALLVARLHELRRLRLDPRLGLGDQRLLPLGEPAELGLEVPLSSLEVVLPGANAVLDTPLRLRRARPRAPRRPPARASATSARRSSAMRRSSSAKQRERVRPRALQQRPQLGRTAPRRALARPRRSPPSRPRAPLRSPGPRPRARHHANASAAAASKAASATRRGSRPCPELRSARRPEQPRGRR